MRISVALLLTSVLWVGTNTNVLAQDDDSRIQTPRTPASPSFSFFPPGARAMAMGATFVAIADDATASEANPAGLTVLTAPEVSFHFRGADTQAELPSTALGATGTVTSSNTLSGPSFVSFVFPFRRVAVSFYHHRQTDSEFSVRSEEPDPFFLQNVDTVSQDILSQNTGISAAVQLGRGMSVGGSLRFTRLSYATSTIVDFVAAPGNTSDPGFGFRTDLDDSGTEMTGNIGVLFNAGGSVSAGLVYKQGADFTVAGTDTFFDRLFLDENFDTATEGTFSIPNSFAAGIAYRPTENWLVGLDTVWIEYSVFKTVEPIDDAVEVHLGAEYLWPATVPFAVRVGMFTDPDHDGFRNIDSDQVHFTFGGGVVLAARGESLSY